MAGKVSVVEEAVKVATKGAGKSAKGATKGSVGKKIKATDEYVSEWSGKDPRKGKPSGGADEDYMPKWSGKDPRKGKPSAEKPAKKAADNSKLKTLTATKSAAAPAKKAADNSMLKRLAKPAAAVAATAAAIKYGVSKDRKPSSYKVNKGDTLSDIAKANGTTVKALLAANKNIKDMNKIGVGQSINMGSKVSDRKSIYDGLASLKGRGGESSSSQDKKEAPPAERKHGGMVTHNRRGSTGGGRKGGIGVGAAQRGYGAVRSK